jgi:sarcosine oxidase
LVGLQGWAKNRAMDKTNVDVVVVGLGAVGSATCHHLARLGVRVLGIDRFHPPHEMGSSHGLTRITRLALGEGAEFVPLAQRSHGLWRALEAASGESLYSATGGLCIASAVADADPYHGQRSFFARTVAIAQQHGIEHELLDAAEIRHRFPMFQVADDERGYFEHAAGVLRPERIVAAQLAQARRFGAVLHQGERVLEVLAQGSGGVCVRTERGEFHAARVVLATGAWLPGMPGAAPAGLLRVHRQVLHWFEADDLAAFDPAHCPVWIWMHGRGFEGSMYGFPTGDGVAGVKVATENYDGDIDPDHVQRKVSADESAAMHQRHIAGRLAGVRPRSVRAATCLYTCTPDASFVVRAHDAADTITVVSACSGHGFKHSAALGESLAHEVMGLPAPVPLAPWR